MRNFLLRVGNTNKCVNINKLETKVIKDKSYFVLKKKTKKQNISDILKTETPKILQSIKWVKSMRWGNHNDRWIRPIKNILCIFNNKLLKIKFADLDSNNFTFGNYHFEEKKFRYIKFKEVHCDVSSSLFQLVPGVPFSTTLVILW